MSSAPPIAAMSSMNIGIPIKISPYFTSTFSDMSFTLDVVVQHIMGPYVDPCLTTSCISMLLISPNGVFILISVFLYISYNILISLLLYPKSFISIKQSLSHNTLQHLHTLSMYSVFLVSFFPLWSLLLVYCPLLTFAFYLLFAFVTCYYEFFHSAFFFPFHKPLQQYSLGIIHLVFIYFFFLIFTH